MNISKNWKKKVLGIILSLFMNFSMKLWTSDTHKQQIPRSYKSKLTLHVNEFEHNICYDVLPFIARYILFLFPVHSTLPDLMFPINLFR